MSPKHRVEWTQAQRDAVEALLGRANGRRTTRLLSLAQVERCAEAALESELGFAWISAGEAPDARAVTSVCLCAVAGEQLTIGAAAGHGAATPASAWADIPTWDRYRDSANASICQTWARKVKADRLTVPLVNSVPSANNATRDDLLAAVLANPDDDAPRLVFADWLIERGDPRGGFISIQCELARGSSRAEELERESQALLESFGQQWLAGLNPEDVTARFRRGFVEHLELRGFQLLTEADAFFEREPVTSIIFEQRRVLDAERFANSSWIGRLRSLELRSRPHSPVALKLERLGQLLESRHLRNLARLAFLGQRLGDEGLALLGARAQAVLPNVESLTFEADNVTVAGLVPFAESRLASRLSDLSLSDNPLGVPGTEALADARSPGSLVNLALGGCQVGNEGAKAIAFAARFRTLQSLSLPRNRITVSGLNALLQSENLANVSMDLSGNPVGAAGKARLRARFG